MGSTVDCYNYRSMSKQVTRPPSPLPPSCQALLAVTEKAVQQREKELGFSVLLRLSASLAVHHMTTLKGEAALVNFYSWCA